MTLPYCWYDLKYGVQNLVRWFPIIWRDRDWDWVYIAEVLKFKLEKHAELEERHGHHVNSLRDARNMRICAELLKRLIADEYWDNAEKVHNRSFRSSYKLGESIKKADREYLGRLLGKHLTSWWD